MMFIYEELMDMRVERWQLRVEVERLTAELESLTKDLPATLDEPDTDAEVIIKMRAIARRALEQKP
jgi:hypothetical protein